MTDINERLNYLLDLGKCRAAAALAREELAKEPRRGAMHTHLARALTGLGEAEAAVAAARDGVKYAAFDAWAHDIHGLVLARAGRLGDALAATAEALRLAPDWVGGYGTRCWVQNSAGRYAAGLATAEAGLRLDPENWQLLKERAWSLYKLGELDASEAAAVAGRALHPTRPAFPNMIGCVAMSRGEKAHFGFPHFRAADDAFVEALRLNPAEPTYHDNRRLNARIEGKRAATFWGLGLLAATVAAVAAAAADGQHPPERAGLIGGFLGFIFPVGLLEREAVLFTRPRLPRGGPRVELPRRDRLLGRIYWAYLAALFAACGAVVAVAVVQHFQR